MKYAIVAVLALLLMGIVGCTSGNGITSAAVADIPDEPVQEKTTQEIVEEHTKGKLIPNDAKYYYIRISEKGTDPQTIVGNVGEKVIVDIINTAEADVHFISTELALEKVLVPGEEFNFEFTPKEEAAHYMYFTTTQIEDKLGGTSGIKVDADDRPNDRKVRVVTLN